MVADAYARGRPNALNALRLVLAIGVIFWHSFPLTGIPFSGGAPLGQLLGYGFVDGFFAISGFLIVRSWMHTPDPASFLTARGLRIFPAFWVCLVVTAVVLAPLSTLLSGQSPPSFIAGLDYVLRNAALWMFQFGIDGTLTSVPYPDVWNGSLWTLSWEFFCYLATLALGVLGLLRRTWPVCLAFAGALLVVALDIPGIVDNVVFENAARFALVFLAGCVLAVFQDQIPLRWWGVGLSVAVIAASLWLPDYRVLAAPALAYALVATGGLISIPRLALRNDISYGMYIYAFPVQQLLAIVVGDSWGVAGFWLVATLCTVPLAAGSWFLVERPALRLKRLVRRRERRRLVPSP